ncbi:MAG: chemotaxis protein CheA [Candidatus Melainabacteria bacterium]
MGSIDDDSLLQEFVAESRDHLSSIEPDLLVMEREGANTQQEIINRIFRAIHSIKGASGFFGLEALKRLSHSMESVLMMIRDGKLTPDPGIMDPLLVGVDRLGVMLNAIHDSENVPYQDVVDQLDAIMAGGGAPANQVVQLASVNHPEDAETLTLFKPDLLSVESAVKHGQNLFLVRLNMHKDLELKDRNFLDFTKTLMSTGNILDTALDMSTVGGLDNALETDLTLVFLYGTVLEADLVAVSLDLPPDKVDLLQPVDVLKGNVNDLLMKTPEALRTPAEAANTEVTAVRAEPESKTPVAETETKDPARKTISTSESLETIRVRVDLLNRMMDLAGEMVLARNQLVRALEDQSSNIPGLSSIMQNVDLITTDLQEHIMQTRMQPIASVFGKFPRVVRDMSRMLSKEIELQMSGEEVELDKTILESLSDPLTHLIRNCCDHALETPEERRKAGKSEQGKIFLDAYQESGQINISISDDGRGIDHERIAKKAIASGAISEAEVRKMSPQEQVNLIFLPGLSTAEKVSDISGRGVGMDVVRTNIAKIGGTINVETALGVGTTILLRLPLTLAIIPSLTVKAAKEKFAIPQINLVEMVSVSAAEVAQRIEKVGTAPVLRLRGKLLPLVRLSTVLGMKTVIDLPEPEGPTDDRRDRIADRRHEYKLSEDRVGRDKDSLHVLNQRVSTEDRRQSVESDYNILVLKSGHHQYGLIVDEILDMEEIVVKPLSSLVKNSSRCFTGATIMGDGSVAMILDASGIMNHANLSFSEVYAEEEKRQREAAVHSTQEGHKQAIILFNNAMEEIFAIPLATVLRLEKFETKDIERIGHRQFLSYRGKGLPLIRLEEHLPVGSCPMDLDEAYLIVPKFGDGSAGIVASRIIDAFDVSVTLDTAYIEHPGVSGSAVINNHLTLFIQPDHLLRSAGIEEVKTTV